jgi:hypothetical protein
MDKYIVIGLQEPGKVNVFLNGNFRDICLFNASQNELADLYREGCPFVKIQSNTETLKPRVIKVKTVSDPPKSYHRKPKKDSDDSLSPGSEG